MARNINEDLWFCSNIEMVFYQTMTTDTKVAEKKKTVEHVVTCRQVKKEEQQKKLQIDVQSLALPPSTKRGLGQVVYYRAMINHLPTSP
ncbi:hypothetical protein PoB_003703500 [Plakobranchus ocellatus]|uniref:Uncharacterized protein n=1 Tax=Plakobranchus ocellatus TaxID=259542 RepID=A0AAV4AUF2_9GAST|nr:hypothetical protein PoB_003703500 [Plakobranchus ocellatus]